MGTSQNGTRSGRDSRGGRRRKAKDITWLGRSFPILPRALRHRRSLLVPRRPRALLRFHPDAYKNSLSPLVVPLFLPPSSFSVHILRPFLVQSCQMDQIIPVPFPTLARHVDEPEKPDDHASVHSRVHSSPTSPNPWTLNYPRSKKKLSVTSSGSPRRSHVPLTPPLTPSSSFNSASGNESSDRDNHGESTVPSTPPESPLRTSAWNSVNGKRRSNVYAASAYMSPVSADSDSGSGRYPLRRMNSGSNLGSASPTGSVDSITPRLEKIVRLDAEERTPQQGDGLSSRASEILNNFGGARSPTRLLMVRNAPPQALLHLFTAALHAMSEVHHVFAVLHKSHRTIVITFFDVRGSQYAKQQVDGKTAQEFFDSKLNGTLRSELQETVGYLRMDAVFIEEEHLQELARDYRLPPPMLATFYLTIEGAHFDDNAIRTVLDPSNILLNQFVRLDSSESEDKFLVECYDARASQTMFNNWRQRKLFGAVVRTYLPGEERVNTATAAHELVFPNLNHAPTEVDLTSPVRHSVTLPEEYHSRPRSVSTGERMGSRDAVHARQRDARGRDREREMASDLEELGVGRMRSYDRHPPPSPSRRRSISVGPEPERDDDIPPSAPSFSVCQTGPTTESSLGLSNGYNYEQPIPAPYNPYATQFHSPPPGYPMGMPPPTPHLFHAPPPPQHLMANDPFLHAGMSHDLWGPNFIPPLVNVPQQPPRHGGAEFSMPSLPHFGPNQAQRTVPFTPRKSYQESAPNSTLFGGGAESASPTKTFAPPQRERVAGPQPRLGPRHASRSPPAEPLTPSFASLNPCPPADVTQKNQLDLDAIANGIDTRTTVMIKNIPNKMTDKDLMDFIAKVCPRRIDFLYLRMDFSNNCNVGYAFVNFITVQDLLHFASTQLGVKWNMYSSEKYLQLSYANYQGKEALVEKFKNSCIMDEQESWRPKIFYSSGPKQGLPEPFPAPTHLRRKERSAHNRGALFVPGPGSHHHQYQQARGGGNRQPRGPAQDAAFSPKQYPPRMAYT
ncbi:hypothetical protein BXZ70DRAFT_649850 [Cristinia sonorae]|uniref:Mei2-like C-terminal RNA recognition motif domain-containing protein n=1 Tax=Cristinia sonorae TaxID=1940300 RepID=A0A8K0UF64_9AGAR|nr:hypothetical protein BXZ70DRAFT_649850 [Cristinia sonorae]